MSCKKVLIADDEDFNFLYIKVLLKKFDCDLIHVKTGREAVDIFNKENFDLILMDLRMPDMDGFEAAKEIRKKNTEIPMIAQTAFTFNREDFEKAGFSELITKPLNETIFKKIVDNYLDLIE